MFSCRIAALTIWGSIALLYAPITLAQTMPPRHHDERLEPPLPDGALLRLGSLRLRHSDQLSALTLSRDGKLAAASSYSEDIRVWNMTTGKLRRVIQDSGEVGRLVLSPDKKLLASATKNSIRVWDLSTGKRLHHFDTASIYPSTFSPDGKFLIVSGYRQGTYAYDVRNGKVRSKFATSLNHWCFAYSPDGKTLAIGGDDGTISFWNASGKQRYSARVHNKKSIVSGLAFSPDGKYLASTSDDKSICLWNVANRSHVWIRDVKKRWAYEMSFSPNGKCLFATVEGTVLARLDAKTGKELVGWEDHHIIGRLAFAANGKFAVFSSSNGPHAVRMLDLGKMKEIFKGVGHRSFVDSVAYSSDGKWIASSSWLRDDRIIRMWDAKTGRLMRRLRGHTNGVTCVAFSPDSKTLVSTSWSFDRTVRVWDVATGKPRHILKGHPMAVCRLAFSPDGKTVATSDNYYGRGHTRNNVLLWDVVEGKLQSRIKDIRGTVASLAFAPDGKTLAVVDNGTVVLFDLAGDRPRRRLLVEKYSSCAVFSPDGWYLAAGHQKPTMISLVENLSNKVVVRWHVLNRYVGCAKFSPDGRILATAGAGTGEIQLWDTMTGKLIKKLTGHSFGAVGSLDFSPDGQRLISGGRDSTILVWDMKPVRQKLAAAAKVKLSSDERNKLWQDLGSDDAGMAYRAGNRLIYAGEPTVDYLKKQLRPVAKLDPKKVQKWLSDLDSKRFAIRAKASAHLEKAGEQAIGPMRQALKRNVTLEVRLRLQKILHKLESQPLPAATLQALRAVRVLERIGSGDARRLLHNLSQGQPGARLTEYARRSLLRWR